MLPVEQPFKTYTGLDGKPLDNGYVYFGLPYQNPITHPVEVYWDAAGTLPAFQPLRTVGGYIMNAGTPANLFFDGAYSELVQDKKRQQVFYARTSEEFSIAALVLGLAKAIGSSLIGFIQAGVGAVMRTVQDKLRETVSVKDFGAKGDGVTDDTAAIRAAITELKRRGGGILFFPIGTYLCNGLVLDADGLILKGESRAAVILRLNGDADLITLQSGAGQIANCGVRNMTLQPNGYSRSALVIAGSNPNDFHDFYGLTIMGDSVNTGFYRSIKITGRTIWSRFTDIDIRNDRDCGIWCETALAVNLNTFTNVRSFQSQQHGAYFNNTSGNAYFHGLQFWGCNFEFNGKDTARAESSGLYLKNCGETKILGCYIEDNGIGATDGLSASVTITGTFGVGISIDNCLLWGSHYSVRNVAGLSQGQYSANRVLAITEHFQIQNTNPDSAVVIGPNYNSNTPTGGRGVNIVPNVNADTFAASLLPLIQPVSSETTGGLSLHDKSLIRYTNGAPLVLTDADLDQAAPGQVLWIVNDGGNTVTLTHGANLLVPGSANLVLTNGMSAQLVKVTATKWRVLWWSHALGGAYAPVNAATLRTFDAPTVSTAQLANVVGTLIADLQASKLLR